MQQHAKLPRLASRVPHLETGLQLTRTQRDRVRQSELVRPRFPRFLIDDPIRQTKVKFHRGIPTGPRQRRRFRRRLAQILPARSARESMLRKLRSRVVRLRWTEELDETPPKKISKPLWFNLPACARRNIDRKHAPRSSREYSQGKPGECLPSQPCPHPNSPSRSQTDSPGRSFRFSTRSPWRRTRAPRRGRRWVGWR